MGKQSAASRTIAASMAEFGRTQGGNNNAYCQDNEISWLNWDLRDKGQHLVDFVSHLNSIRQRLPILHRARFLTAVWNEELGIKDVTWLKPSGEEMDQGAWDDDNTRCIGILLDGRAQVTGIRRRGSDATVLIIVNSYHGGIGFTLPTVPGGLAWTCLVDTNLTGNPDDTRFDFEAEYIATGRSLLMFELVRDKEYVAADVHKPVVEA